MNLNVIRQKHLSLYCPVTGTPIIGEDFCNNDVASLKACWVDICLTEPDIRDPELNAAWERFSTEIQEDENRGNLTGEDVARFLKDYEHPNWCVFQITIEGQGPFASDTGWHVLDFSSE